ncbi:MAG TPA: hypothetical protein P5217_07250 [Methanoregulaceae archaeon]|nr:hypothetical protein [Methanoregulaceae archaeon]HPD75018.1 hypothetical protein [Methanoregulaceae archaeon]HRY76063.1 hypothetical protein [Methanoregulaceae archaeon]
MQNQALIRLRSEIRHFSMICLLNLVFAALAMAFGIGYMVSAVSGLLAGAATPLLRMIVGVVAFICFGFGIQWLLTTIRIFEGIEVVQDDLDAKGITITDERITCLIVQMLCHYRDNRTIIGRMIHVCTLGGICFFGLGIGTSLEFLSISSGSIVFTLNNLLVIPAMVLTLGMALVSLLSSYYFSKFAKVWDQRLHEIEESECVLKKSLELEEE